MRIQLFFKAFFFHLEISKKTSHAMCPHVSLESPAILARASHFHCEMNVNSINSTSANNNILDRKHCKVKQTARYMWTDPSAPQTGFWESEGPCMDGRGPHELWSEAPGGLEEETQATQLRGSFLCTCVGSFYPLSCA